MLKYVFDYKAFALQRKRKFGYIYFLPSELNRFAVRAGKYNSAPAIFFWFSCSSGVGFGLNRNPGIF
jgi:hypothetical protein